MFSRLAFVTGLALAPLAWSVAVPTKLVRRQGAATGTWHDFQNLVVPDASGKRQACCGTAESLGNPDPINQVIFAIGEGTDLCGATVSVTGPTGKVTGKVVDCGMGPGTVDMSSKAWSGMTNIPPGIQQITWSIDSPGTGPVTYASGSSVAVGGGNPQPSAAAASTGGDSGCPNNAWAWHTPGLCCQSGVDQSTGNCNGAAAQADPNQVSAYQPSASDGASSSSGAGASSCPNNQWAWHTPGLCCYNGVNQSTGDCN